MKEKEQLCCCTGCCHTAGKAITDTASSAVTAQDAHRSSYASSGNLLRICIPITCAFFFFFGNYSITHALGSVPPAPTTSLHLSDISVLFFL